MTLFRLRIQDGKAVDYITIAFFQRDLAKGYFDTLLARSGEFAVARLFLLLLDWPLSLIFCFNLFSLLPGIS